MLRFRTFNLCLGILISILAMSNFAAAQDASVRKDLEVLYAKRERAIKDKDVAALRSTETKDFWVGEDYFKPGEESMVKSERIFEIVTKVNSLAIRIDNLKEGNDQNEMVVEAREYGKVLGSIAGGAPEKGVWLAT